MQHNLKPIWHGGGGIFYSLVLVGSDFVSWIFLKNFQTFLEVKIYINRVILTPAQLIESYKSCALHTGSFAQNSFQIDSINSLST